MAQIRVFVSIPVPDPAPLGDAVVALRSVENVRPSPVNQMHITLRFIGDVEEASVPRIAGCVRRACSGVQPFEVTMRGTGAFPNARRPSVVWVGAEPEDVLRGMSDRLAKELSKARIRFDDKPFKSHVTIGRCRGPASLDGFFREYGDREFLRFQCDRVLVMRSVLSSSGARHSVLETVMLG